MNGYLLSVIGTVLLCTLFTALAPEGKTSAVIKGIAKLLCVLAIIAPVLHFFKTGDVRHFFDQNPENNFTVDGIAEDASFIKYYSEYRIRETEKSLAAELEEKFGYAVVVSFIWSMQEEEMNGIYALPYVRIDEVCILPIEETPEEVKEKMELYVTENYLSEVLIE